MNIDNEPATTDLSIDDYQRHMAQTVKIEVHRPRLHLSQGSWLRCSRRNINETIRGLMSVSASVSGDGGPDVHLTVYDSVTAASLRRLTEEQSVLFAERDARAAEMTGPEVHVDGVTLAEVVATYWDGPA